MADRTDAGRVVLYLATDHTEATRDLAGFEKQAQQVGVELGKMIDQFDGKTAKVQAETMIMALKEVGGTTKLTTDELKTLGAEASGLIAKFKTVGAEVPAELQKVADAGKRAEGGFMGISGMLTKLGPLGPALAGAFGVQSIIAFGGELLKDGDALQRMSDQTGIGVVALQKLRGIAVESGNDLEQLTNAISQMQKRLAEGDSSAVGAVNRLGLSLETLKSQTPDEQFMSIARAVAKVPDPMERTRDAMELFGKSGAKILPTLIADVDGIAEATATMSEKVTQTLDRLGDKWEAFKNRVKVAAATAIFENDDSKAEADAFVRRIEKLKAIANGELPDTQGLELAVRPSVNAPFQLQTADAVDLARAEKNLTAAAHDLAAEQKRLADEAKKAEDAQKKFLESIKSLTSSTIGAVKGMGQYGLLFDDVSGRGEAFGNVLEGLNEDGTLLSTTFKDFNVKLQDTGTKLGVHTKEIQAVRAGTEEWKTDLDHLASTMTQFAQVSGDAFGGVIKDIANMVVSVNAAVKAMDAYKNATTDAGRAIALLQAGTALMQATTPQTTSRVDPNTGRVTVNENRAATVVGGATTGASIGAFPALAAATGGASILIGAGIGALIGWIRSGAAEKEVNKVRQSFVDAAGGLDLLNKHAHDSGVTLDALLNAKSPEQYNKAITELTAAMAKHDAQVQRVSAGVTGLYQSWQEAGEYIPLEQQKIVDEMLTMNGLTDDQRKMLEQMSSAAEPNYQKLTELAGKYGVSLDALGPKFQQANIDSTAEQIFKDFDQITRAGGDVGGVLAGMADEISKLVDDSIKFGTTIPDNMKPLIENLIKAGKLTDDAGNAITDISQIHFGATPLDKSTSAIVDAVHELRDALLALPENAAKAAAGMSAAFGSITPPVAGASSQSVIPMAEGGIGRVMRPTLFFSRGNEDFAFSGEGRRFGGGGSGAPIEVPVYLDGALIARGTLPHLYEQSRLRGVLR